MESKQTLEVVALGAIAYPAALALQEAMVAARHADAISDTLLLLEHPHVFTLGRGADERYLLAGRPDTVPVFRISRGGQVTYHGPGQLVGYPILKLKGSDRDVHVYIRRLEEAMIRALAEYGVGAERRQGLTGVWVGTRKIGFIGVGIRRWVTYHGFALNVCPDLDFFRGIVPCGIEGCETTSLAALGHGAATVRDFAATMCASFQQTFGYAAATDLDPAQLRRMIESKRPAADVRIHRVA